MYVFHCRNSLFFSFHLSLSCAIYFSLLLPSRLLSRHPKTTMSPSGEANSTQDELSSRFDQTMSATNEPTVDEIRSWSKDELLKWIQQQLPNPLEPEDAEKCFNARINGHVFLKGAGDKQFFRDAGLSFEASVELAELAKEAVGRKSKYFHGRHADSHRSCQSTS